jgi:hypothetical protein
MGKLLHTPRTLQELLLHLDLDVLAMDMPFRAPLQTTSHPGYITPWIYFC